MTCRAKTSRWFRPFSFGFISCLLWSSVAQDLEEKTLHIGTLLPMSNHWWADYANCFPIIFEHVFKEVANRSDILPGYRLQLVTKDNEGNAGLSGKAFMELVNEGPATIVLLGPGLSDPVNLVGQITPFMNMVQMSFSARSASLVQRSRFSSLYMSNYMDDAYNPVRLALMKYFKWHRIGTLATSNDIFTSQISSFHKLLERENFTLVTSGIIADKTQIVEHIQRLKQYDARIIIGAFRGTIAPYVFCEAYKQGLYGRQYVWILPGSAMYANWVAKAKLDVPCTRTQLYDASNGYLSLDHLGVSESSQPTVSGKNSREIEADIRALLEPTPYKLPRSFPFAYDAAWSLALALNKTLGDQTLSSPLENFTYDSEDIYNATKRGLESITFNGISGPFAFGPDGQRVGIAYVLHTVDDVSTTVASYDPRSDDLSWTVDPYSLWPDGKPPRDRFIYEEVFQSLELEIVIPILTLNTIGCVVGVVFLLYNIIYRKHKLIKMSSPNINNIIIVGCLIMYVNVFLYSGDAWYSPNVRSTMCMARIWISSIGFTLSFGALFSKTWRVHKLFRNTKLQRKSVKDGHLLLIVGLLVLVDLVVLIAWSLYHPLSEKLVPFRKTALSGEDIIRTDIYSVCYNEKQVYWFATQYIYKGLLLMFGTFLAWETRTVNIPALNDSRHIGFCVYNVVVVCLFAVPVYHVLDVNQSSVRYTITSCFIIFCTTLVLCIVFLPKMRLSYKNVDTKVFITSDMRGKSRVPSAHDPVAGGTSAPPSSNRDSDGSRKELLNTMMTRGNGRVNKETNQSHKPNDILRVESVVGDSQAAAVDNGAYILTPVSDA